MRSGQSWRNIIGGTVLLFVACLVADMATPLLPAAFRLHPSESIDAVARRIAATAVVAPDQLRIRYDPGILAGHHGLWARPAASHSLHRWEGSVFRPRLLRAFPPNESAIASDDD
jgi:hypothetical protein